MRSHLWKRKLFTCVQRNSVDNSALIVGVVLGRHLGEFYVTQMQYSGQNSIHRVHLAILKSEHLETHLKLLKLVDVSLRRMTMVCEVSVIPPKRGVEVKFRETIVRLQAVVHVIEDVEVSFAPAKIIEFFDDSPIN